MGGPAAMAPAAVTSPRVLRWRSNDTGIFILCEWLVSRWRACSEVRQVSKARRRSP